jgi:DNA-binding response OmpR family regulator
MKTDVLLVTDQPEIGRIWCYTLQQQGLTCQVVAASEWARERRTSAWGLAVVDLYRVDADPLDAIRGLRQQSGGPILVFRDLYDEAEMLRAYDAGAHEVVLRPISPVMLSVKVQAWLRHAGSMPLHAPESIERHGVRLEPRAHTLTLEDGRVTHLSSLEFRVLYALMAQARRTVPIETLLSQVWGEEEADAVQLKNIVYRLRRKIEPDPRQPRYIHTAPGQGYSFDPS